MRNKWLHRIGSVKLGVILLLIVAVAVVAGTIVVQKPLAEPGQIEKLYSPTKLKVYEALGLFDLYHTWWFTALLVALMANIVAASLERLPVAWREIRRRRDPDEVLMRAAPLHAVAGATLDRAAGLLREHNYKVREVALADGRRGFAADKQRYARLAPYFVHLSLLIILLGGVIDSRWGYRAFMKLNTGEQKTVAHRMLTDHPVQLPYAVRCDDTGMEAYPDGSPKRYWSKLAVVENDREVVRKEIEVNSPLVYRGVRFFQSSFGRSGELQKIRLAVGARVEQPVKAESTRTTTAAKASSAALASTAEAAASSPHGNFLNATPEAARAGGQEQVVELIPGEEKQIPEFGLRLRVAAFFPDFYIDGGQVATRSDEPNNPAVKLEVLRGEEVSPVWVFANYPQFNSTQKLPVKITVQNLELANFTGLQVTSQPGQWLVWAGCTIMAFGFVWAFFFAHRQFWALELPGPDGKTGLLLAGVTSKHHEEFRDEFGNLTEALKEN